jgi:thiol-disulfide isomerase/thioredoxin
MASKKTTKKATTNKAPARKAVATKASTAVGERTKYFTASWCGPCQLVHRMLAKHPDLAARLEVIDIDEHEALADRYEIQAVPTFVRPDGKRESGALSAKELRAFLGA